jgi:uridine kinase
MAFEFHHLDKWGYANLDLVEEVEEHSPKAVVLIAGASSAGKSFAATFLKNLLGKNGHKAVILSLDQYNFGLSGIVPNKVNDNFFGGKIEKLPAIEEEIKKIIYHVPFEEKFSAPILLKIKEKIKDLLPADQMEKFLSGLSSEWKKLNFDEPSVYNLKEASQDIHTLFENGRIFSKLYSKVVSERVPSKTEVDGSAYDVILCEGIYGLTKGITDSLSNLPVLKNFVDGNAKSLFLRRIIRDSRITSADNIFTVSLYFKYIVESYQSTILPAREEADVILNNDMTFTEMRAGSLYVTKDEIFTPKEDVPSLLIQEGKVDRVSYQRDFFFTVKGENPLKRANNILRMREISSDCGKTYVLSSLVHKGAPKSRKDDKLIRPINVLLKEGEIEKVWKNEEECLSDFKRAGFEIGNIEIKKKTYLIYKGQEITMRNILGKGTYIEFTEPVKPEVVAFLKGMIRQEKA